jgi:hypothetical protein
MADRDPQTFVRNPRHRDLEKEKQERENNNG